MGTVIVVMQFGISGVCIFLGIQIDRLKSTIKKQQKQIDCLNNHINSDTQDRINIDIIDICKDIAKKVISIEERVDKLNSAFTIIKLAQQYNIDVVDPKDSNSRELNKEMFGL